MQRSNAGWPKYQLDNMPPKTTTQPVTLGDLKTEGRLVWVYCLDCCLEREFEPEAIPLPLDTPVPEVGRKLKCKACGGRLSVKPQLYQVPMSEL